MHGRDRSESTLAGRAERRVGARSLGPFLFLGSDCRSVSSQGPSSIRHRPYWSYGLLAGVLCEAASGGGTGTSCWRLVSGPVPPGPGSPADGQGTASRLVRPRSRSAGVSRRRCARKIAMTPVVTCACCCDGDMPKPQKHAPARHCVRTTSGNPRSAAGSGRTMPPGRAEVRSRVRGVASRGYLAWLGAGHAGQGPVTSSVLTCQG